MTSSRHSQTDARIARLAASENNRRLAHGEGTVAAGSREGSGEAGARVPGRAGKVEVADLDGAVLKNDTVLRRYQRRWAKDERRSTIAVKAAQIGYSTASAAWAVDRCLVIPKRTIIFLSRSERQSLELAHRAKEWLDGYHGAAADWLQATESGNLKCYPWAIVAQF